MWKIKGGNFMKCRWRKILSCTLAMALLCIIPAQASEVRDVATVEKVTRKNVLLTGGKKYSLGMAYGETRGSIISQATVGITDLGEGEIEILVETLAQKKSDEIRHVAILEVQESDDSWTEVARYEFDAVKENYPDQDLSGLTNQFRVKTLEINRYYRVRGIHYVWIDGKSQGFSTQTEGLLIKKYPG